MQFRGLEKLLLVEVKREILMSQLEVKKTKFGGGNEFVCKLKTIKYTKKVKCLKE